MQISDFIKLEFIFYFSHSSHNFSAVEKVLENVSAYLMLLRQVSRVLKLIKFCENSIP